MGQKEFRYDEAENPAKKDFVSKGLSKNGDKRMTVREVAEALNVDPETIKVWVRKLYPEIIRNGVTTYLNEAQATRIKQSIGTGRNDLQNILQVKESVTSLEIEEMTLKVIAYHKAEVERLKAELAVAKPKAEIYEQISDSSGLKSLQEVAKILGYGPKQFFKKLRDEHILYMDNGVNLPYQEFIDNGIFVVREEPYVAGGESRVYSRIFVTGKGELWLTRKIGREV